MENNIEKVNLRFIHLHNFHRIEKNFQILLVLVGLVSVVERNYFLRFRFRLLKRYGSGSDFWKSYGSGSYFWKVTVPVPAPYLYHKKPIFRKKFVSSLHSKLFYKEKDYKYQQIYCKMWKKKMLNEGNQIHNFISPEP